MAVDTKSYVPDFAIKIKGKPFRLGADGAPIQHDKLTPIRDARLDVLSVSVTESTDKSDNCQIRLRGRLSELQRFPSGDELLWIDDDLFTEGNKIEIEMGYVGNRALHFVGEITALSVSFADNGVPTLSVEGQSLYHRLHRGRQDGPLEPMSDSDIVKKIAGQCKLKPSVEPTEVKHSTVAYAGKTFHTILQDRAKRTGCEVAVKGETLYFQKPGYQTKKSAKLSLTWGKDLLNFSARLKTTNVPTTVAVRGTMTNKGGPKEGVSATVNVASRPSNLAAKNPVSGIQRQIGQSYRRSNDTRVTNPQDAQTMAQADSDRATLDYNQGQGASIGNPQLQSREVIKIINIGKRLSGKYYVVSTTHTIDAGGYRTTFQVKRDG